MRVYPGFTILHDEFDECIKKNRKVYESISEFTRVCVTREKQGFLNNYVQYISRVNIMYD